MRVLSVEYFKDYKLKIMFSDRVTKIIDFEEKLKHAKGIFLPLKNIDYFKRVSLDDCCASICWPNGADICPDLLYTMGKEIPRTIKKRKRISSSLKIRKKPKVRI
jgi:hypothetical protein